MGDVAQLPDGDGGVGLGTVPGQRQPDQGEEQADAAVEVEDKGPAPVHRDLAQERRDQECYDAAYAVTLKREEMKAITIGLFLFLDTF